jgi:hypothetical protein
LKTTAKCKQVTTWVAESEAHLKYLKVASASSYAKLVTLSDKEAAKSLAAQKAYTKAGCKADSVTVATPEC